jgi:hypothetical protein
MAVHTQSGGGTLAGHSSEDEYAWASLILGRSLLGQRTTVIVAYVQALGSPCPREFHESFRNSGHTGTTYANAERYQSRDGRRDVHDRSNRSIDPVRALEVARAASGDLQHFPCEEA